jgi:septal ring factor EnvC (AmiA/AmiB activator)
LDDCAFTEYNDVTWKFIKATGNIRCGNTKRVSAVVGNDTRWRFDDLPEIAEAAHAASPPRSNPRPKKKRNTQQLRGVNQGGGVPSHDLMLPGPSLQAAVRVGLAQERGPTNSVGDLDFKKLYEELKKEHGTLEKKHEKLRKKYQEKKDHKETAKEYVEKSEQLEEEVEQLKKELDIERRWRKEEQEEKEEDLRVKDEEMRAKDATIERLEKRNRRLEERIKSLDSICSPRGSRQVSL